MVELFEKFKETTKFARDISEVNPRPEPNQKEAFDWL
jgi:hypothetical protein